MMIIKYLSEREARWGVTLARHAHRSRLCPDAVTLTLPFNSDKYYEFRSTLNAGHCDMTTKQFTREQVSKYNSKTESVFIIDNVVYDVSKFLDEHPGGHEVLLNQVGKDASEDFDDVGHSIDAKELMKKYVVGELVAEDRVERERRQTAWEIDNKEQEASFVNTWKFPVLIGIVVTVLYSYLFG